MESGVPSHALLLGGRWMRCDSERAGASGREGLVRLRSLINERTDGNKRLWRSLLVVLVVVVFCWTALGRLGRRWGQQAAGQWAVVKDAGG